MENIMQSQVTSGNKFNMVSFTRFDQLFRKINNLREINSYIFSRRQKVNKNVKYKSYSLKLNFTLPS